ncbi:MAG: hypothetical protein ACR2PH_05235, partial [Desulfobulbia bacterium]
MTRIRSCIHAVLLGLTLTGVLQPAVTPVMAESELFAPIISELSSFTDRSSGTRGNAEAAAYISDYLANLGLAPQDYFFQIPIREVNGASLSVDGKRVPLQPLMNNAVTPQAINGTLSGPLYY